MLDNRFVQRLRKLSNRQVFRHEPGGVYIAYILGKHSLASVRELDYPDEQVANIVAYQ
jgi:hypothetical protein